MRQLLKNGAPLLDIDQLRLWFIYQHMQIPHAIRLMRETCVLRHFSIKTEKTYTYWLRRYGAFLKDQPVKSWTTEQKIERFLTLLAMGGASASTQNQAFNALLFFYRHVLKQELGPVDAAAPSH